MSNLKAGAARVEITPQKMGIRLGGHAVNRVAVGMRDPLYARAVALSDGGQPLVIVSLDLIGLMNGFVNIIRDRLPQLDRTRIWICTTHTHDGPDTIGFWGPMIGEIPLWTGLNEAYMDFLLDRVVETIEQAVKQLEPVKMRVAKVGTPSVGLTRNVRREFLKDDEIQVMHLQDRRGGTIAILYNYASHPEFFGHHHHYISAGWPGVTNTKLESDHGGVALLLQNALGGMVTGAVTRDDGSFSPMIGTPFVGELGLRIAEYINQSLAVDAITADVQSIRTFHESFALPITNRLFLAAAYLNIFPRWILARRNHTVMTEVNVARIGTVVMATLPGEALPDVGFAVKKMLGSPYGWVANLANDELGYLLPELLWEDPRYRYERSMSPNKDTVTILLQKISSMLSTS